MDVKEACVVSTEGAVGTDEAVNIDGAIGTSEGPL